MNGNRDLLNQSSLTARPRETWWSSKMRMVIGSVLWLIQPLYFVAELITVSQVSVPYSLLHNTISDAMVVSCTTATYPWGPVPVCSPLSWLLNGATVVLGIATAIGAVMLHPGLPTNRVRWWVTALAVGTGVSMVGTGLVPLDVNAGLHYLVAAPQLLTVPAFLIVVAVAVRGLSRPVMAATCLWAGLCIIGSIAFVITIAEPQWGGLLERLALWPVYLALPAVAVILRHAERGRPG